jgi:hypothetical protein
VNTTSAAAALFTPWSWTWHVFSCLMLLHKLWAWIYNLLCSLIMYFDLSGYNFCCGRNHCFISFLVYLSSHICYGSKYCCSWFLCCWTFEFRNINCSLIVLVRWQARREGDRNMRAGLIPSRALQERRILHERTQQDKSSEEGEIRDQ